MTMSAQEVRALREKNAKERGTGKKWLKIEGDTVLYLRVGPPWKRKADGEWGEIWKDCYYHGKYPNKLYCPAGTLNKKGEKRGCIICRRLKELKADKTAFGKRLYKLLVRRHEGLWNIIKLKYKDVDGEIKIVGRDGGWQVMRLASSWHNELLDLFTETEYRKNSIFGVADLKFGRVVRLRRTGSGLNDTEYRFKAFTAPTPAAPSKEDRLKLRAALINLDEAVALASKEELETMLRRCEKKAKAIDTTAEEGVEEDEENEGRPKGKVQQIDGEEEDTEEAEGESEEESTGDESGGGEDDESGESSDDDSGSVEDDTTGDDTETEGEDEQILAEMKRGTKKPRHVEDEE